MRCFSQSRLARPGFTLIEVVTSLAVMSVLMVGLSGAVMIGSHAIPTTTDTGLADQKVVDGLNQLRMDLREASTIQYRNTGTHKQVQLVIKSSGAKGAPSTVGYSYTISTGVLKRQVNAETATAVITGITTFAISVNQDGSDARSVYLLMVVDDTIQRIYEMHAALPDKPEVL